MIYIQDGNPTKLGEKINVGKQRLVYKIITTVRKFQSVNYNLNFVPLIQQFFVNAAKFDDEKLYELSLQREPKGASRNDLE